MIIALFPNEKKQQSFEIAKQIASFLQQRKVRIVAEKAKAEKIGADILEDIDPKTIDFMISMGGDGTILRLCHNYSQIDAPILGINLGHLGFMADIPVHDIYPSLEDLFNKQYQIDKRIILELEGLKAVNDIVIHRAHNYSLIELAIHVDGFYLNTFTADGIIIATPNGSTAYSLAAGGPIVNPNLEAIVITPICPHTISNRPIVLSANQVIEIEYISEYDPIDVRADGMEAFSIKSKEKITIRKSEQTFKLVNLYRHEYFSTLRSKLSWSGKARP